MIGSERTWLPYVSDTAAENKKIRARVKLLNP
jgi:hypothetical protein